MSNFRDKWDTHIGNCEARGIESQLSLEDYTYLASQAGITPEQIGKTKGSYQLGRLGDTGSYSLSNCRFITIEQNLMEQKSNGGTERIRIKLTGRTKETHEHIKLMAENKIGRTKETHSGHLEQSKKVSKSFRVVNPQGEVVEGVNFRQFCKDNGLSEGNMSMVRRGIMKHCRGWTYE